MAKKIKYQYAVGRHQGPNGEYIRVGERVHLPAWNQEGVVIDNHSRISSYDDIDQYTDFGVELANGLVVEMDGMTVEKIPGQRKEDDFDPEFLEFIHMMLDSATDSLVEIMAENGQEVEDESVKTVKKILKTLIPSVGPMELMLVQMMLESVLKSSVAVAMMADNPEMGLEEILAEMGVEGLVSEKIEANDTDAVRRRVSNAQARSKLRGRKDPMDDYLNSISNN